MMMLSTRTMQMRPVITRIMTNDVAKHKNNANEAGKHNKNANEAANQGNDGK